MKLIDAQTKNVIGQIIRIGIEQQVGSLDQAVIQVQLHQQGLEWLDKAANHGEIEIVLDRVPKAISG